MPQDRVWIERGNTWIELTPAQAAEVLHVLAEHDQRIKAGDADLKYATRAQWAGLMRKLRNMPPPEEWMEAR